MAEEWTMSASPLEAMRRAFAFIESLTEDEDGAHWGIIQARDGAWISTESALADLQYAINEELAAVSAAARK